MLSVSSLSTSGYNKSSQVRPPKPIDLKSLHTPHKLASVVCRVPEMKKDYLPYFKEEDHKKQQQLLKPFNSKQQLLKPPSSSHSHHHHQKQKHHNKNKRKRRKKKKNRRSNKQKLKNKPKSYESKYEDDDDSYDDDDSQINFSRQSSTNLPGSQSIHNMKTQNSFRKNNTFIDGLKQQHPSMNTIQETSTGYDRGDRSPIINISNMDAIPPIQPNNRRFISHPSHPSNDTNNSQNISNHPTIIPPSAAFTRPKPQMVKAPNMSSIKPEDLDQQISFTSPYVPHMKDIGPSPSDVSIGNKSFASSMFSDDDEKKSKLSTSQRFMDLPGSNPEITDGDDDNSSYFSESFVTDDDVYSAESDDLITEDDDMTDSHEDSDHHQKHRNHHHNHRSHRAHNEFFVDNSNSVSIEEEKNICIRIAKVLYENSWTGEMICDANEFSKQEYDAILGVGNIPTDSVISNLVWKVINYSQKKTENELINEDKEHIKWYWFDANDMESDWKYRKYNVIICEWITNMYKDFLEKHYHDANNDDGNNDLEMKVVPSKVVGDVINSKEIPFAECQANFIKLQQNKGKTKKKKRGLVLAPGEEHTMDGDDNDDNNNDGNDNDDDDDDGKDDFKDIDDTDVDDIEIDVSLKIMNSKKKKQLLIDPYFSKNENVDHFLVIEKDVFGVDILVWHKIVMKNNDNGDLEYCRQIKMDHRVVGVKPEGIVTTYEPNPSPFAIPSQLAA